MQKRQAFLTLLLVITGLFVQGCMVAAVGVGAAGTVAYAKGDLEAVESKDIDAVYSATRKALDELGLTVTRAAKDAMSAEIIARDAHDKKTKIRLTATAEGTTKLSIRVGIFGSETKSRLIYQEIRDNLQ